MNSSSVAARRRQPRSARRSTWRCRIWRGRGDDGAAVGPLDVGHAEGRARVPREQPQRRQIRRHHEVAVAALPRGHRVAGDGVHVDVDREQVVAAFRAGAHDVVEEVAGGKALALQTSLHVGDPDDDRVDLVGGDECREPIDGEAGRALLQSTSSNRARCSQSRPTPKRPSPNAWLRHSVRTIRAGSREQVKVDDACRGRPESSGTPEFDRASRRSEIGSRAKRLGRA